MDDKYRYYEAPETIKAYRGPSMTPDYRIIKRAAEGDTSWMVDAACRDMDTILFYPSRNTSPAAALRRCSECTVRAECLQYALDNGEKHGIWGGMGPKRRRKLAKT